MNANQHTATPHVPGTLPECPLCETKCYCGPDFMCLACTTYEEEHYAAKADPMNPTPEWDTDWVWAS